jgi:hypothetical protein
MRRQMQNAQGHRRIQLHLACLPPNPQNAIAGQQLRHAVRLIFRAWQRQELDAPIVAAE